MLRGSAALEQALAGSHAGVVKCEAWLAGRRIAADLPLLDDASVSGDSGNFVRRTASLNFVEELSTGAEALAKTLARPGAEVRVWRGANIGGIDRLIPVHWGLAENPKWDWPSRHVSLSSPDLAMRVSFDRFPRPQRSSKGFTVAQQIGALVKETLPGVRFVDESADFTAVSDVVWEKDRNDAITKLATAIGCETFFRPDGAWVLRHVSPVVGLAAHRVRESVNLADASVETDWTGVRNHIVAYSDRADGVAYSGESIDNDPTSPTYVFGPLRRRTGYYASSLFTTNAQCANTAAALRSRMQGARVSVAYTALAHPGVEAGDRHDVIVDGTTHRLVLDSFSYNVFGATMQGSGRSAQALEGVD